MFPYRFRCINNASLIFLRDECELDLIEDNALDCRHYKIQVYKISIIILKIIRKVIHM